MLSLGNPIYTPSYKPNGNNTEQTQYQLIDKRHPVCHTIVFYKVDAKPRRNPILFAEVHIRLDQNLYRLVDGKYK